MPAVYIIGDIHGQFDKLLMLLQVNQLLDGDLCWCGGDANLWILGDLFDRGLGGKDTLRLLRRLQYQASVDGGKVGALLGNHEILLLAARRFGEKPTYPHGNTFRSSWKNNGGLTSDLTALVDQDVQWLLELPAVIRLNGNLLMHADALFYLDFGSTVDEINQAIQAMMHHGTEADWNHLLDDFSQREAFWNLEAEKVGRENAQRMLSTLGGKQIIHGHTPIGRMLGISSQEVTQPLIYHQGLCVNVDGGMYLGGSGIVYKT